MKIVNVVRKEFDVMRGFDRRVGARLLRRCVM